MKRFAKHFLAILLIVSLILPLCPAKAASENGRLITVTAQDIFSDRSLLLEVLVKDGLCYITPEEAAKLTGAEYHPETGVPSFQYNYTWDRKSLDARQIPHTKYAGVQYYRLEKICELLETWVGIPKEGILYFNSVPYNLGMLFAQVSGMLEDQRYDADRLHNSWLTSGLYVVGNMYDIITNLRFSYFWGGSRQEDFESLLLKLVKSPDLESENISKKLKEINKNYGLGLDIMTHFLSKLDLDSDNWADWADYFNELLSNSNGWKILTGLRNADDIIRDINSARKLDLANLFFRSDLRKMFGEASQETGLLLPPSLSAFDLSDILSLGAFYISVMQADSRYIQALEEVVSTYPRVDIDPTLEGLWSATQKTMIRQAANPIIDNYHAVLGEDDFLPSLAVKISELISQNLVSSTIKYLSFSSPQVLALKAASFVLDRFAKTKEKVTAIREMVLNIQIQDFIRDYFNAKTAPLTAENARGVIGAAELYLNAALNTVKLFSYETLGTNYGVPTHQAEAQIEELLLTFMAYQDYQFRFETPNEELDGTRLKNQNALAKSFPAGDYQIQTVYADSGSFLCDCGGGAFTYSYSLPRLEGDGESVAEFNREVYERFNSYVQSQNGSIRYLTHEHTSVYDGALSYDTVVETNYGDALTDLHWEASVQDSLLNIALFTTTTDLWNQGGYPQLYAVSIDMTSGKMLSTEELLSRLGLTKASFWAKLQPKLAALTPSQEDLQFTAKEAQEQMKGENWLWLDEEGCLEMICWICDGSAKGHYDRLVIDLQEEILSADEYMEQGRQLEEEALRRGEEAWKAKSVPDINKLLLQVLLSPDTLLAAEDWFLREMLDESWLLFKAFLPDTTAVDRPLLQSALAAYEKALDAGAMMDARDAIQRVKAELAWGHPVRAHLRWPNEDGTESFFRADYLYNEAGQPTQITVIKEDEPGGVLITYSYDAQGRETEFAVTTYDGYQPYVRQTAYDTEGNITAMTVGCPDDSDMTLSFVWTYDAEGRILTAHPAGSTEDFYNGVTFTYAWSGNEPIEINVSIMRDEAEIKTQIVPVYFWDDAYSLSARVDAWEKDEWKDSLPLFDASLDENGRIEILELWNGLLEFVFPGTTFYGYAENGAVSSISTEEDWYAYDYTDCCFDSFGRYTYYSFSHWEESSDLYGTDWSRALTFRFDELGQLRTEAVYEVDGMENYASISYAYDFK